MNSVQTLSRELIEETLQKARLSPRKRAMYCFSGQDEPLQRMINAGLKGTYIQPHKHENPDKFEVISIAKGRIAVFTYSQDGSVSTCNILDEEGPVRAVEIPARVWHNMVLLTDEAACHEIILGSYEASTHKQFASWAPSENEPAKAAEFMKQLEEVIEKTQQGS